MNVECLPRYVTSCRLVINSTFGEVCCLSLHLMDTMSCAKIVQCSCYRPRYSVRCPWTAVPDVRMFIRSRSLAVRCVLKWLGSCSSCVMKCGSASKTCATNVWLFLSALRLNYSLVYTELLYCIATDICRPCLSQPALTDSFLLLIVTYNAILWPEQHLWRREKSYRTIPRQASGLPVG
jgi:hypothetical protein